METIMKRNSSHRMGSFPSSSMSLSPRVDRPYAHSMSGGAGGHGIRISRSTSYSGQLDSARSYDDHSLGSTSGSFAVGNEKATMQHLNDRLSNYLETVRNLEQANGKLETKIFEFMQKTGPAKGMDYSKYNGIIADLRFKIADMIKGNTGIYISLDNTRLAADDFKVKLDYEMGMRQAVEADISGLRKMLDDTNVVRLHLESDIESLREELITLRKYHDADVAELRAQITQTGVQVDIDAPRGQDMAKIMEEMRDKYERVALKNQEELKAWHESQITEVQVQVTQNTAALKGVNASLSESRRTHQTLDIDLQAILSLKASLEATLRDVERRYNMEIEKYNEIILRLQEELSNIRSHTLSQTSEYEILLNIKTKLEAEIAEYRRLLDGEAREESKTTVKILTVTQTLVDGKVVSETKDVRDTV